MIVRSTARNVLLNGLLVLLSVLLTVAGLEILLRIRQPPNIVPTKWNRNTLHLHHRSDDPVLKYDLTPGAVVERDGVVYRIDAQGLRYDTDIPPKRPNERRIVLLGDSVAFGLAVNQEQTFAHLLELELTRAGPFTRVLNESVLGYKTAQEVRRFERDGSSLEPDGVVVVFCLNDFDDYSPELSLLDPVSYLPLRGIRNLQPRRLAGIELPDPIPLMDRSLVFREVSERLLRIDYYRWIGTDPGRRLEVATALDELGATLHRRRIPGLLVILPLLLDNRTYAYGDIHQFVSARAAAAGFAVVDLLHTLRVSLPTLRRRPDDVLHLSPHGHEVVARALAPCLADPDLHCPPTATLP